MSNDPVAITLDELTKVAEVLYGVSWKSVLFEKLGWSRAHGYKVINDLRELPVRLRVGDGEPVLLRDVLRTLINERINDLVEIRKMLNDKP